MITIFTPTYNRAHTLPRLFDSLCRQSCMDFEWLVVDDGSLDETEDILKSFCSKKFSIRYYKKKNGGKHTAINYAVPLAAGEWFFIVDSDDYLRDDAIAVLTEELKKISSNDHFCGIVGLKLTSDNQVVGSACTYQYLDTDFFSYRAKYKMKGDRAEVVRISVMKQFPFPEFSGENFCTEAVVWNRIARHYIARYIDAGIYFCEYLPGGLSDTYKQIMDKNPQSSMLYEKEHMLYGSVQFRRKVEAMVYYMHYARLTHWQFHDMTRPVIKMIFYLPFVPFYIVMKSLKQLVNKL